MEIHDAGDKEILQRLRRFEREMSSPEGIRDTVRTILEEVKEKGDDALFEFTRKFDGVALDSQTIRVGETELEQGYDSLSTEQLTHIRKAKAQIEDFHRQTLPRNWMAKNGDGAEVGEQFYPIRSVGLYVPGGAVPLVSSVLMSAVLAKIAGNPRIVVVTPPLKDGTIAGGMLAALKICGVDEIYKVGGAQAIAALAYGTQTITGVDKVFGPGNAYVLEAKRQLFGEVGIDLLPGPSEVAVVADQTANPEWVAADLLAQAEHGSGKERILLLADSETLVYAVHEQIRQQTKTLTHGEAAAKVVAERCMNLVFRELEDVARVLNQFAPEHLELQVRDESVEFLTRYVTTAGAMLIGHYSPTVLGDFTAGPSHTLPTGGAGRFMSGLRLTDFLRRTSVVHYRRENLEGARPVVDTFACLEQLDAHGRSLQMRNT